MFYVLLTGEGDGCDYTIGCNKNFSKLKATTLAEAEAEVDKIVGDYYGDNYTEPRIAEAIIIETLNVTSFDIATHRDKAQAKAKQEELEKTERTEKELLRQLKSKWENKK